MTGTIKIFGIIILCILCSALIMNYGTAIVNEENIYESTRTTQLSVIADSLNLGDFRINEKLSIERGQTIENWMKSFNENNDLDYMLVIEIIDILEYPASIAVRVKGYSKINMQQKDLLLDYKNIVLLEKWEK